MWLTISLSCPCPVQIADASIKEARATKQSNIDKFFAHLSWGKENLSELKLYKILPVNFPARITDAMMFPDRHYHLFSKQIPGALVKSFSDHSFTMGGELVEFVPIQALRNAWSGFGDIESSPTAMWFFSSVLVDFFCVTRAPPNDQQRTKEGEFIERLLPYDDNDTYAYAI